MIDTTLTYIDKYGIEQPLLLTYYYSRIEEKNLIYGTIPSQLYLPTPTPYNDNNLVNDIKYIDYHSIDNNLVNDIKYIDYHSIYNDCDISVDMDYGYIDIYPIKTKDNKHHKPGIIDWFLQCTIL